MEETWASAVARGSLALKLSLLGGLRASAVVLPEFKPGTVQRHPPESRASLKRSRSLSESKEKLSGG